MYIHKGVRGSLDSWYPPKTPLGKPSKGIKGIWLFSESTISMLYSIFYHKKTVIVKDAVVVSNPSCLVKNPWLMEYRKFNKGWQMTWVPQYSIRWFDLQAGQWRKTIISGVGQWGKVHRVTHCFTAVKSLAHFFNCLIQSIDLEGWFCGPQIHCITCRALVTTRCFVCFCHWWPELPWSANSFHVT